LSSHEDTATAAVPPHVQIIQMGTAGWVSAIVSTAARLGLADQLAPGPKSAAELAGDMGLHAPSLHRMMRSLAGLGILTEDAAQRFALTPLGHAMRAGAPGGARGTLLAFNGLITRAWEEMPYSLATGKPAFDKTFGMPLFEYIAADPDLAASFSEAMVGFHGQEPPAVAAAYDFSGFQRIADVGGATGNMLAAILSRHAGPRGVLFDLPHVVAGAPALLAANGVAGRVEIESGSFFDRVPAGADCYVLSHVIHDWTEEQCLTILGHCRKAIAPNGRLLIVEMVLPAGDTPHPGKVLDMVMLTIPGGQERTEAEYATLLGKAGFRLARVVPTASAVSVVEALPA
jgi:hypothetical protein